jgi:tRNA pseudouridine65 synthase
MLSILYQDDALVVVNKPAGLLVHKSPIDRHETQYAMRILRDQIGCWVYPVHRLDKPTSGVLVFGLSSEVAAIFSAAFENHEVEKDYLAVVRGFPPESGCIDHPIRETAMFKSDKGKYEAKEARSAITHYQRLATIELPVAVDKYPASRYALMRLSPVTGRQHQLRRHMKHLSHPIIGDPKYGKSNHNRFFAEHIGVERLLLACMQMGFKHPLTGQWMRVRAPLDAAFDKVLSEFGWSAIVDDSLAMDRRLGEEQSESCSCLR